MTYKEKKLRLSSEFQQQCFMPKENRVAYLKYSRKESVTQGFDI